MNQKPILRQADVARKQLALLRLMQQRALGALQDAAEWQGKQTLKPFARVRDSQFENYVEARREARAAGVAIFG